MRKAIFSAIIPGIAALAFSCSVETGQPVPDSGKVSSETETAVKGQLLIRFSEDVSGILDKAGLTKSGPAGPATRSGISSVDEVLELLEGYEIERVFPEDRRSEEKARREGLHLWYLVKFDENIPLNKAASDLSALGEIRRVEYNRQLKRAYSGKSTPASLAAVRSGASGRFDDVLLPYQWSLVNDGNLKETKFVKDADVQVEKAWNLCTGDPFIIVAVLDEGVDWSHPDLAGSMWVNEGEIWRSHEDNDGNGYAGDYYGYNFARGSAIISTDDLADTGHGSHVAGVIGAVNNNGIGISSIAGGDGSKPGVRIMSCQIFSGNYAGTVLDEVRAIKYAADNGAVILQCSWGYVSGAANPYEWTPQYGDDDSWMQDNILEAKALDYFIHNAGSPDGVIEGGIAVFAGGNEDAPAAGYPGAYKDFVSVAATAGDFTPSVYTNYGPGTTICAPGGDQDYYYEYGEGENRGSVGCILSTLPPHISESGYGYMEGTSMACPHVSGVVALGLSYAAQLRKHFKAEEIIDLLYSTAIPVEGFWNTDTPKNYYKYVAELGDNHFKSMDLNQYTGKMGNGQVNAYGFLKAIEGSGTAMSFPNVLVEEGGSATLVPSRYFTDGDGLAYSVTVKDGSVASASVSDGKLTVKGLRTGQTAATVSASDGRKNDFVITVRANGSGEGWL
ncbi:MAG: S8 family peptidase [Candidatus Cryptobacteroides sp.]